MAFVMSREWGGRTNIPGLPSLPPHHPLRGRFLTGKLLWRAGKQLPLVPGRAGRGGAHVLTGAWPAGSPPGSLCKNCSLPENRLGRMRTSAGSADTCTRVRAGRGPPSLEGGGARRLLPLWPPQEARGGGLKGQCCCRVCGRHESEASPFLL